MRDAEAKGRGLVQETDAESVTGGDAGWPSAADFQETLLCVVALCVSLHLSHL